MTPSHLFISLLSLYLPASHTQDPSCPPLTQGPKVTLTPSSPLRPPKRSHVYLQNILECTPLPRRPVPPFQPGTLPLTRVPASTSLADLPQAHSWDLRLRQHNDHSEARTGPCPRVAPHCPQDQLQRGCKVLHHLQPHLSPAWPRPKLQTQ